MSVFLEVVGALLLGLGSGVITGIAPGIHVNLVAVIMVSLSPFLLEFTSPLVLCVYIISLGITHTFCDGIPSVYLGAPDESKVLSVLPGHRMLRVGKGHLAIMLLTFGAFASLVLGLFFVPLFLWGMVVLQPLVSVWVGYVLIVIVLLLILREKDKWIYALGAFLLSGVLGVLVFGVKGLSQPLFPLLSGLFGLSLLIESISENTTIPEQSSESEVELGWSKGARAVGSATGMGFIAAFLPGFGSSQAAIVATKFAGDIGEEGFIVLVGGINTANVLLSIVAIYAINKARNGAIVAVQNLMGAVGLSEMLLFLGVAVVVGALATIVTLRLSRIFGRLIATVNYAALVRAIILFIVLLAFLFDGLVGVVILGVSTAIGILVSKWGVGKNHLLGCLLLPVILYFVG